MLNESQFMPSRSILQIYKVNEYDNVFSLKVGREISDLTKYINI